MAIQKRKTSLTWGTDYEPGSIYGPRFIDLNSLENESPLTKFSEEFHWKTYFKATIEINKEARLRRYVLCAEGFRCNAQYWLGEKLLQWKEIEGVDFCFILTTCTTLRYRMSRSCWEIKVKWTIPGTRFGTIKHGIYLMDFIN